MKDLAHVMNRKEGGAFPAERIPPHSTADEDVVVKLIRA